MCVYWHWSFTYVVSGVYHLDAPYSLVIVIFFFLFICTQWYIYFVLNICLPCSVPWVISQSSGSRSIYTNCIISPSSSRSRLLLPWQPIKAGRVKPRLHMKCNDCIKFQNWRPPSISMSTGLLTIQNGYNNFTTKGNLLSWENM